MRILPITLLFLVVAALPALSPAQDEPAKAKITIGDKELDAAALGDLRAEVQKALDTDKGLADPKNPKRQALEKKRDNLDLAAEIDHSPRTELGLPTFEKAGEPAEVEA